MAGFDQHLTAGGEFLRQDRVNDARDEFLAALELRPDDARALGRLGLAYFRLSSFDKALPVYEKLVELEPNDASFWLNLGLVHLKLGNPDEAVDKLSRSRELDPSQARTVSYLGLAYARNGDFAEAYEAFLHAEQRDLAAEMAKHLEPAEAEEIAERVERIRGHRVRRTRPSSAPPARALGSEPPVGSEPEPEPKPEPEPEPETETAAASESESVHPRVVKRYELEDARDREQADMEEARAEFSSASTKAMGVAALRAAAAATQPSDVIGLASDAYVQVTRDGIVARDGVVAEMADPGVITKMIQATRPIGAAAMSSKVAMGHLGPQLLTDFATSRLIRPDDGTSAFELGAGGVLIVRVADRIMSRTEDVIVSGGELAFEPATRRVRGTMTAELFGEEGRQMFIVSGSGYLVASPAGEQFAAVQLDDDILYLRESLVWAFESDLRWETGHVPGSDHRVQVVQFRGHGCVAIRSRKPLLKVKLGTDRVTYVEAGVLAGWIGRVVPRWVSPVAGGEASAPFVECSGEGVVLIEDVAFEDQRAPADAP